MLSRDALEHRLGTYISAATVTCPSLRTSTITLLCCDTRPPSASCTAVSLQP